MVQKAQISFSIISKLRPSVLNMSTSMATTWDPLVAPLSVFISIFVTSNIAITKCLFEQGKSISDPQCTIKTLLLNSNELLSDGGEFVIRGLIQNTSIHTIDISNNVLDSRVAESLSLVPRGLFVAGKKICNSNLRHLNISDNPDIGAAGAKTIFSGKIPSLRLDHDINKY